jgi:hypothetical protein
MARRAREMNSAGGEMNGVRKSAPFCQTADECPLLAGL